MSPDRQGVCNGRAEVRTVPWAGLTLQFASVDRPGVLGEVCAVIVQKFELCLVRNCENKVCDRRMGEAQCHHSYIPAFIPITDKES